MTANSNAPTDTSRIMAERSAINNWELKSIANHFERSTARRRRDGDGGAWNDCQEVHHCYHHHHIL